MFIDLNLRLEDTVRRKRACERLEAKLRDIEERISRGRDLLQALKVEEIEEMVQIENLRRLSISSLIYTLLFAAEGELTKGEIEYIKGRCKAEDKKEELFLLEEERLSLKASLAGYEDIYKEYAVLMKEKKSFTTKGKAHINSEILRLSEELALSLCLIKEIKELLREVRHLDGNVKSFINAFINIDKLKNLKTERERLVRIKELRNCSLQLNADLASMAGDLKEISKKGRGEIGVNSILNIIDLFTQSYFIDFYEKIEIKDTIEKGISLKRELELLQSSLERKLIKEEEALDDIKRSRISYIEAL